MECAGSLHWQWSVLDSPLDPTEASVLGLEPHRWFSSVRCLRWGLRLGRMGVAKGGNSPGGGRAEPTPGPGRGCHSLILGKLRTAPNSPQNNQTTETQMENLGKQKQLYQGWVKNQAWRAWAVIPRLLWCLGIHRGTPGLGSSLAAEAGSINPSVPPPSSASAQLFPCFPAFLP